MFKILQEVQAHPHGLSDASHGWLVDDEEPDLNVRKQRIATNPYSRADCIHKLH
jgi:hypothetical protein